MRTLALFSLFAIVMVGLGGPLTAQDPFGPISRDPFGGSEVAGDPFSRETNAAPNVQPPLELPASTPALTPALPAVEPALHPVAEAIVQPPIDDVGESDEASVLGTITKVTLYRDSALVTREIEISADDESGVVTISSLPEMLIPDSVYAEGDQNVLIRGVRVSSRPTSVSDREEVRTIERKIAENQSENTSVQQELRIIHENLASVNQLTSFTASKTSDDLNRGTLDAKTLVEVSKFIMDQRRELMTEQLASEQRMNQLRSELSLLQRQLAEVTAADSQNRFEAKIFVDVRGEGTVRLSYQVSGCSWTPQYAIRGQISGGEFNIRYSAIVQQLSGEDWDGIQLTLSTASPSVSAVGPTLAPFRVTPLDTGGNQMSQMAQGVGEFRDSPQQLSERVQSIKKQQRSAETKAYGKSSIGSEMQRDMTLNSLAAEMQQLELDAEANTAARLADDAKDDVATQVYSLEQQVSLQSRRQQQMVQIADMQLSGELYHVATPLLSSYAYREAEINNTEPIGLLGGFASVYLDDRFMGRCELPTTASGQRLIVGFGADQQVRIRRELRDKKDVLRGGNRNLEFTYRLVVANFKDKPVQVRLYDRIPVAAETRDVMVNVTDTTLPISTDGLYERVAKDQGILRWDIEIPAERHGENAFDVEYTYNLDFDKNRLLTTQGLTQQTNADLFFQRNSGGGMGGGMGGMGGPGN